MGQRKGEEEKTRCLVRKNTMMQLGEIIARLGRGSGNMFLAKVRVPIDNGSWRGGMTQWR